MSDPPATNNNGSSSINLLIDASLAIGESVTSVKEIKGFYWRMRVSRMDDTQEERRYHMEVFCTVPDAELWHCDPSIKIFSVPFRIVREYINSHLFRTFEDQPFKPLCGQFSSWYRQEDYGGEWILCTPLADSAPTTLNVELVTENNSESFTRRPSLEEQSMAHDVVLVMEGEKIPVNRQVLVAQSNYFKNLFFGGFKESEQKEIEIKDVNSEDFNELLKMIYGTSAEPTTEENALRYLKMADIFDLKIARDRVENFILSSNDISHPRKLLLADQNRLETCKREMLQLFRARDFLVDMGNAPEEFAELSNELKVILFVHACKFVARGLRRP